MGKKEKEKNPGQSTGEAGKDAVSQRASSDTKVEKKQASVAGKVQEVVMSAIADAEASGEQIAKKRTPVEKLRPREDLQKRKESFVAQSVNPLLSDEAYTLLLRYVESEPPEVQELTKAYR
jgi:hypothetical protein